MKGVYEIRNTVTVSATSVRLIASRRAGSSTGIRYASGVTIATCSKPRGTPTGKTPSSSACWKWSRTLWSVPPARLS